VLRTATSRQPAGFRFWLRPRSVCLSRARNTSSLHSGRCAVLHKFLIRQDALAMAKIAHSDFLGYQKRSRRQPDRIAGRWNRGSGSFSHHGMNLGRRLGNYPWTTQMHFRGRRKLCFLGIARPPIYVNKMSIGWRRSSGGNTMPAFPIVNVTARFVFPIVNATTFSGPFK
jgi:hypothetical protein